MGYTQALAKLYHLIIEADGKLDSKEIDVGEIIVKIENIDKSAFFDTIKFARESFSDSSKVADCIAELESLSEKEQVRCMAWMGTIAQIDGVMEEPEWELISQIYVDALDINIRDVLEVQTDLKAMIKIEMFAN